MSIFAIVFLYDLHVPQGQDGRRGEVSVYEEKDEETARKHIEPFQKVANIELIIREAADADAAWEVARTLNETRHCIPVKDTLSNYWEHFGEKI